MKDGEGGATGEFLVDLKNGSGSIKYFEAGQGKGDCQIAVKVSELLIPLKIDFVFKGSRLCRYDERKAWPAEGLYGRPDQGEG